MEKKVKRLKYVFYPRSIAIVGASRNPMKIGHTILRNFVEGGYDGKIYPINPKADRILGIKAYPSLSKVGRRIDNVIVAVPAKFVPSIVKEMADLSIPSGVIISGGFSEVGRADLEEKVRRIAEEDQMAIIGPNCMGVLNPEHRVDSIFLPIYKTGRPVVGNTSFISQSGAIGGIILDLAATYGVGMAKFVSYGNAAVINEIHLLQFLASDKRTEKIVMYMESSTDGRRLYETLRRITPRKPVVILKGGKTRAASQAAKSHTGKLAGDYLGYRAAFRQSNSIEAETFDDLFNIVKAISQKRVGPRVAILTNGGGMGVITVDALQQYKLQLAQFSEETLTYLQENLPDYASIGNPLDIIGDADAHRYEIGLNALIKDKNVDSIIVITLFQTVNLDSRVVSALVRAAQTTNKFIAVVAAGGTYTELHKKILDSYGVPTYSDPYDAVRVIHRLLNYQNGNDRRTRR